MIHHIIQHHICASGGLHSWLFATDRVDNRSTKLYLGIDLTSLSMALRENWFVPPWELFCTSVSPNVCTRENQSCKYLGDSGVLFLCAFQEFQGGSNGFCFQSLNPNILLSFFRFSVAGERSGGPGGPGTRVAIDSDPSKHFG